MNRKQRRAQRTRAFKLARRMTWDLWFRDRMNGGGPMWGVAVRWSTLHKAMEKCR